MQRGRTGVLLASALALLVASCGGGSEGDVDSSSPPQASTTTTDAPFSPSGSDPVEVATTTAVFDDGPLAEVCGDTIVVQTSSFPDVGAGPLYALLGAAPSVDADRQTVSAPLTRADGRVDDVTLEIRSGGPAVDFRSPISLMADDDAIHLAVASTAVVVRDRSLLATTAVMTLTDRSRDAVIIDPASYPEVTDLAALGAQDIEIRHVTDAPLIRYLTATGVLSADQLVAGSDGDPASFVAAGGALAQQGDLTIEPALLPALPQWARPVTALPASAAGWSSLDDMLVVDAAADRLPDDCLGRLVRVMQQSIVAYIANPVATNLVMSDILAQFNPLARLTPALFGLGTQLAIDFGVFDTTRSDAPGTIDTAGFDTFLADLASALDVEPVTIDELVDARFLDSTVSR